ncbi:MAG: hypothetical protein EZS28_006287, partial [Streblomastix strix]
IRYAQFIPSISEEIPYLDDKSIPDPRISTGTGTTQTATQSLPQYNSLNYPINASIQAALMALAQLQVGKEYDQKMTSMIKDIATNSNKQTTDYTLTDFEKIGANSIGIPSLDLKINHLLMWRAGVRNLNTSVRTLQQQDSIQSLASLQAQGQGGGDTENNYQQTLKVRNFNKTGYEDVQILQAWNEPPLAPIRYAQFIPSISEDIPYFDDKSIPDPRISTGTGTTQTATQSLPTQTHVPQTAQTTPIVTEQQKQQEIHAPRTLTDLVPIIHGLGGNPSFLGLGTWSSISPQLIEIVKLAYLTEIAEQQQTTKSLASQIINDQSCKSLTSSSQIDSILSQPTRQQKLLNAFLSIPSAQTGGDGIVLTWINQCLLSGSQSLYQAGMQGLLNFIRSNPQHIYSCILQVYKYKGNAPIVRGHLRAILSVIKKAEVKLSQVLFLALFCSCDSDPMIRMLATKLLFFIVRILEENGIVNEETIIDDTEELRKEMEEQLRLRNEQRHNKQENNSSSSSSQIKSAQTHQQLKIKRRNGAKYILRRVRYVLLSSSYSQMKDMNEEEQWTEEDEEEESNEMSQDLAVKEFGRNDSESDYDYFAMKNAFKLHKQIKQQKKSKKNNSLSHKQSKNYINLHKTQATVPSSKFDAERAAVSLSAIFAQRYSILFHEILEEFTIEFSATNRNGRIIILHLIRPWMPYMFIRPEYRIPMFALLIEFTLHNSGSFPNDITLMWERAVRTRGNAKTTLLFVLSQYVEFHRFIQDQDSGRRYPAGTELKDSNFFSTNNSKNYKYFTDSIDSTVLLGLHISEPPLITELAALGKRQQNRRKYLDQQENEEYLRIEQQYLYKDVARDIMSPDLSSSLKTGDITDSQTQSDSNQKYEIINQAQNKGYESKQGKKLVPGISVSGGNAISPHQVLIAQKFLSYAFSQQSLFHFPKDFYLSNPVWSGNQFLITSPGISSFDTSIALIFLTIAKRWPKLTSNTLSGLISPRPMSNFAMHTSLHTAIRKNKLEGIRNGINNTNSSDKHSHSHTNQYGYKEHNQRIDAMMDACGCVHLSTGEMSATTLICRFTVSPQIESLIGTTPELKQDLFVFQGDDYGRKKQQITGSENGELNRNRSLFQLLKKGQDSIIKAKNENDIGQTNRDGNITSRQSRLSGDLKQSVHGIDMFGNQNRIQHIGIPSGRQVGDGHIPSLLGIQTRAGRKPSNLSITIPESVQSEQQTNVSPLSSAISNHGKSSLVQQHTNHYSHARKLSQSLIQTQSPLSATSFSSKNSQFGEDSQLHTTSKMNLQMDDDQQASDKDEYKSVIRRDAPENQDKIWIQKGQLNKRGQYNKDMIPTHERGNNSDRTHKDSYMNVRLRELTGSQLLTTGDGISTYTRNAPLNTDRTRSTVKSVYKLRGINLWPNYGWGESVNVGDRYGPDSRIFITSLISPTQTDIMQLFNYSNAAQIIMGVGIYKGNESQSKFMQRAGEYGQFRGYQFNSLQKADGFAFTPQQQRTLGRFNARQKGKDSDFGLSSSINTQKITQLSATKSVNSKSLTNTTASEELRSGKSRGAGIRNMCINTERIQTRFEKEET